MRHPVVETVTTSYLDLVGTHAPGLLEGLYLVGSVAMDDFQLGGPLARRGPSGASSSDIDFIAITAEPVDHAAAAVLARVHRKLTRRHRRPYFDGLYLTWAALSQNPSRLRRYAQAHEGRLTVGHHIAPSPVAWHELAHYGVTVHGPEPSSHAIWTDATVLATWCQANVADYWSRLPRRCQRWTSLWSLASLTSYVTTWAVLGVSRSHYTATTGRLISKTGAGQYARETFAPEWHRVIDESLRIRTNSGATSMYQEPFTRRHDTLRFVETVARLTAS